MPEHTEYLAKAREVTEPYAWGNIQVDGWGALEQDIAQAITEAVAGVERSADGIHAVGFRDCAREMQPKIDALEAQLQEAQAERDEWKTKAQDVSDSWAENSAAYDEAEREKARADAAEQEVARLREVFLMLIEDCENNGIPSIYANRSELYPPQIDNPNNNG